MKGLALWKLWEERARSICRCGFGNQGNCRDLPPSNQIRSSFHSDRPSGRGIREPKSLPGGKTGSPPPPSLQPDQAEHSQWLEHSGDQNPNTGSRSKRGISLTQSKNNPSFSDHVRSNRRQTPRFKDRSRSWLFTFDRLLRLHVLGLDAARAFLRPYRHLYCGRNDFLLHDGCVLDFSQYVPRHLGRLPKEKQ